MGLLKHAETARLKTLSERMLIGRSRDAQLQLVSQTVSTAHATLTWRRRVWKLCDLGSRNGTFLNGGRLPVGKSVILAKADRIAFGSLEEVWVLIDPNPPLAMARRLHDQCEQIGSLDAVTFSEVQVYRDAEDEWVVHYPGQPPQPVADQEILHLGGEDWQLFLPQKTELAY